MLKHIESEKGFPRIIVREERLKQVLLIPETRYLQPLHGVVARREDVVNMDYNAWSQSRKYLQKFLKHFTLRSNHMRAIYEKNVVGL